MAWLSVSRLQRWRIVLAVACCLTANPGWAADKSEPISTAARPKKLPKCCVWRVTNAKAPFYLVGSIHSLSSRDYPLSVPYEMALNDSQRIVFEYDPNQDDAFQEKFAVAGKYPSGQDIRNKIHPQTLAWLRDNTQYLSTVYDEKKKKYQTTVKGFDAALQYKPWWIADHFFDIRSFSDASEKNGVDSYFEGRARKAGKELGGLETVDEHVAVLGKLSDRDGEILLLDTLVYMDTAANEYYRIRSAWRRGDVDKLWILDSRLRREASWIAARLVDTRNVMWIPRIEREIQSGKPTTIVVGALHFGGPNSVITLLRQRGYTVEQL
jgi:uncharacterized protein YbaP (TraB family)